jgi:hypothetical protein
MTDSKTEATRPLSDILFGYGDSSKVYAVLDGVKVTSLLEDPEELEAPNLCLFAGKLEPDVARAAPYLVELEPKSPFVQRLLDRCWGKSTGIFLRSAQSLDDVRKHLKHFTMVRLPDGDQVFFRFYDPRVLRVYLPTCNQDEIDEFLGDVVESFLVESEGGENALEFTAANGSEAVVFPCE